MAYWSLHVSTNVTDYSLFKCTREYSKFLLECTVLKRVYNFTRPYINIMQFEVSVLRSVRDGVSQI
jgi:hypothetical protein